MEEFITNVLDKLEMTVSKLEHRSIDQNYRADKGLAKSRQHSIPSVSRAARDCLKGVSLGMCRVGWLCVKRYFKIDFIKLE
jgi:hypothetical protein